MEYDFEQLVKEIVLERLRSLENPYALVGEIVRRIVVSAVTSPTARQDPRATVTSACRGAMEGMLLIERDLAKTAVSLLSLMPTVAQEATLDPGDCMTWAMEGLALVVKIAPGDAGDAVSAAIEGSFMGVGEVFQHILRTAGA